MAAQNELQLTFIDEDDIPQLSIRVIHCDSDQEEPSDVDSSGSDSEEESDEEQESA
ncbi:hypothetical protein AC249_AIPGENE24993 [Exaiptasia diaphana]|nr:hypothetical protein AC249_AIPGENE24993 [Exaiptasia diaphana]